MKKSRRTIDLTIALVCAGLALVTMGLNWNSPIAMALQRGDRINGLVIGSDYEDYTRHSDTLMFVSYDPQNRFMDVLSIPRDTMVSDPDRPRVHRINEVFAYEFKKSGKDFSMASLALKSQVETMLSTGAVHPLDIPYFFTIDYGGFRSMIDLMGGVYVRVSEPMNYDDSWGHLHIHFEPGSYLLNGQHALEYIRFRGGSADQGRVRRQQLFIKEVLKRMKNPELLWRLPSYMQAVWSGFHTNITLWDASTMLFEARRVSWKNLRLMSLPGTPSGMMWKMNAGTTQKVVAMMQAAGPHSASRTRAEGTPAAGWRGKSTVEVWNASARPNAARVVTQYLRKRGFDVVRSGNFSTRQQQTIVIDRSGDLRPAQAVADAMTAVTADVVSRPEPALQVDVSVIVGNDYPIGDSGSKP